MKCEHLWLFSPLLVPMFYSFFHTFIGIYCFGELNLSLPHTYNNSNNVETGAEWIFGGLMCTWRALIGGNGNNDDNKRQRGNGKNLFTAGFMTRIFVEFNVFIMCAYRCLLRMLLRSQFLCFIITTIFGILGFCGEFREFFE
jgi:hypothetical protein